jgi:hypothetical protein
VSEDEVKSIVAEEFRGLVARPVVAVTGAGPDWVCFKLAVQVAPRAIPINDDGDLVQARAALADFYELRDRCSLAYENAADRIASESEGQVGLIYYGVEEVHS